MRYRFFYHFNKQHKKMSVHFKNKCIIVNNIKCCVPTETHWNKRQPLLVVRGFARDVKIIDDKAIIE